jgi:hypothetical protein
MPHLLKERPLTKPCTIALSAALVLVAASILPAEARGRFLSVQGVRGHGFTAGRVIARTPGSTMVTRGLQTNSGRGFTTTRQTHYGDGSLTNNVTRTYNNGQTATRTGAITRNDDGSITRSRSHTGVNGNTQSGWNTIYRTEDGFGRTRGFTTSSGRSATQTGSVAFGDDSMTVNRSITTGSGASASRTTTYTRGD